MKKWQDTLTQEEIKILTQLENQLTILKHKRYKIQNAATKRVTDARKSKARKQVTSTARRTKKSTEGRSSRARPRQDAAAGRSVGAADTDVGSGT